MQSSLLLRNGHSTEPDTPNKRLSEFISDGCGDQVYWTTTVNAHELGAIDRSSKRRLGANLSVGKTAIWEYRAMIRLICANFLKRIAAPLHFKARPRVSLGMRLFESHMLYASNRCNAENHQPYCFCCGSGCSCHGNHMKKLCYR